MRLKRPPNYAHGKASLGDHPTKPVGVSDVFRTEARKALDRNDQCKSGSGSLELSALLCCVPELFRLPGENQATSSLSTH